jgi:signal transduction histidine kinase
MDTLVRARAREPFFTTRASGTGLGLAIVERAVRAHGGQLAIESDREEGTTVRIILPVARISSIPPGEP